MSFLQRCKNLSIRPLMVKIPTVKVGSEDTWEIAAFSCLKPFVIAAGVGKHITFEQELACKWNAEVLLLDPTPTGIDTIQQMDLNSQIKFMPLGLAVQDGQMEFSAPSDADEGSFTMRRAGNAEIFKFDCKSVVTLMKEAGREKIELLKMDIEGFEYSILRSLLREKIKVEQICVELHVNWTTPVQATLFDLLKMLYQLFRSGYRIVYNKSLDFTFVHKDILK